MSNERIVKNHSCHPLTTYSKLFIHQMQYNAFSYSVQLQERHPTSYRKDKQKEEAEQKRVNAWGKKTPFPAKKSVETRLSSPPDLVRVDLANLPRAAIIHPLLDPDRLGREKVSSRDVYGNPVASTAGEGALHFDADKARCSFDCLLSRSDRKPEMNKYAMRAPKLLEL